MDWTGVTVMSWIDKLHHIGCPINQVVFRSSNDWLYHIEYCNRCRNLYFRLKVEEVINMSTPADESRMDDKDLQEIIDDKR